MRSINFGPAPPDSAPLLEQVLWIKHCLRQVQNTSNEVDAARVAQGFAVTNLTEDRAFDCDTVAVAELADAFGTFINDLNKGGQKGRASVG